MTTDPKKRTMRHMGTVVPTDPPTIVLSTEDVEVMTKDHPSDTITAKGVSILLSHIRDIKEGQDKGFDRIERRMDKLDDEIDKLHESLGRALRDISSNATRIDHLDAEVSQLRRDIKEIEKNQHQCRARLNYEDDTGQFQVVRDRVLRHRSTPPTGSSSKPTELFVPPTALFGVLKYIAVGVISALLAAGAIVASAWNTIMSKNDAAQVDPQQEPRRRATKAKKGSMVSDESYLILSPPADETVSDTAFGVKDK